LARAAQRTPAPAPVRRRRSPAASAREIASELSKVVWPTWPELVRMTGVVIVTVIIFSILIGGADLLLSVVVKQLYSPKGLK
jgi:preprotein translocase subunit SecE